MPRRRILPEQVADGPGKLIVCSSDAKDLAAAAAKLSGLPLRSVLVLESKPTPRLAAIEGGLMCKFDRQLSWPIITDREALQSRSICILYSSGTTGLPKGEIISYSTGRIVISQFANGCPLNDQAF